MTIAITGAAGQLGRLTAQLVLDRVPPGEVVLVTRRPDAIADLAEAGATVRHGDFDEPPSLAGGLRRLRAHAADQHRRARQPGGPAQRRHRRRGRGRRRPRDLHVGRERGRRAAARGRPRARRDRAGDPRPRPALDRAAQRAVRGVPGRARRRAPSPRASSCTTTATARTAYVSREDCAAAAAAVLTTDGHEDRVYDITGPELVTQASSRRSWPTSPAAPSRRSPSTTTTATQDLDGRRPAGRAGAGLRVVRHGDPRRRAGRS